MRPVNLIPPEDRRGERAPLRTGPLAYVLVGVLLLGVRRRLHAGLDRQLDLRARGARSRRSSRARSEPGARRGLQSFTELRRRSSEARTATVDSLARSRFDWERVLRELALVIPERRLR